MGTIPKAQNTSLELEAWRDYDYNGSLIEEDGETQKLKTGKGSQRLMRVARRALAML